jgi:hypothetical protein
MKAFVFAVAAFGLAACVHQRDAALCGQALEDRIAQEIQVIDAGETIDATVDETARTPQQTEAVARADAEMESRDRAVDGRDLQILNGALGILNSERVWDRADDRICHPEDTTFSLFCALQRASINVLGTYEHRRTALQEVRFAVEEASAGRQYDHRLRDYNNDPTTTFADVRHVLDVARDRVAARLAAQRRRCGRQGSIPTG